MNSAIRGGRLRMALGVALGLLALSIAPVLAQRLSFTFDDEATASMPDGFFFGTNRQANVGSWQVVGKGNVRHLSHTRDASVTMRGMSLAGPIFDVPQDIKVSTRLRLVDGDGAGGVMWRYKDANNFYFMAVFYADHSASLIRVTGGNRVRLAIVNDINLDTEAWHAMSVTHDGDDIRGSIDGITILRARDRTLWDSNRAGLWSAGNTTGFFDDLTIEAAPD